MSPSEQRPDYAADAARYAVLQRIAPALRHDAVGLMQPIGMQMMILQRRIQAPEPDLQAIAKNLASASMLSKEATAGCIYALGWIASSDRSAVSLMRSVDEAIALLSLELSAQALEVSNNISDDAVAVPKSFFRTVLLGALLAFCDQRTAGKIVQIRLVTEGGSATPVNRLMLRMMPGDEAEAPVRSELPAMDRHSRRIDWFDVEAMAGTFAVTVARGDGWLALGLPDCE